MIDIAIIGAGMAGLACARRLAAAGKLPVLFDKGRGIGGRVATRRADGRQFDHGAQYVTAKGDGFAGVLAELVRSGDAATWQASEARAVTVGTPGMSALAKGMARNLDVRSSALVSALSRGDRGWTLRVGEIEYLAARVILTVPAPQALELLGMDSPLAAPLAAICMEPCLTLMATVAAPAPFVTRRAPDDPLAWIAQDSSKPSRLPGDAVSWVVQAGPDFSRQYLEGDGASIVHQMLPIFCDRLGIREDQVRHAAAHRWRYARVTAALGQPYLRSSDGTLYLAGDWCLGARIEAAWVSGTAAADDLLAATT